MDTITSWTPLFSSIVTSTLWEESKEVRLLFVTMLALKNRDGLVMATMSGLKRLANLNAEEVEQAIAVLESPDTKSEINQEFEGRRIERCEGGWKILNHEKYRDLVSGAKRRAYQASWQKEYRKRLKQEGENRPVENNSETVEEIHVHQEKVRKEYPLDKHFPAMNPAPVAEVPKATFTRPFKNQNQPQKPGPFPEI